MINFLAVKNIRPTHELRFTLLCHSQNNQHVDRHAVAVLRGTGEGAREKSGPRCAPQ